MALNKILLIGNVGRDAELKYTASGMALADFSLAVNSKSKGEDKTEWFNCTMFDKTAENLAQYVVKGKQLYVEGRIQTREWTDDQGQKHQRTEVAVNQVQLLGGRDPDEAPRTQRVQQQAPLDATEVGAQELPF